MLLDELLDRYALPDRCTGLEHFAETVAVGSSQIDLSGISVVGPGGEQITGSAAAVRSRGSATARSYFELLERVSTVVAMNHPRTTYELSDRMGRAAGHAARSDVFLESSQPDRWQPSRSNGVALHLRWPEACDRAAAELVERDRVLRSWYGESIPIRCELPQEVVPEAIRLLGDWRAYELPAGAAGIRGPFHTVCVVGFPGAAMTPLAYGFAACIGREEAINAAASEAVQRFGFLFGETIPKEAPTLSPCPDFHQEFFLFPPSQRLLHMWLDGTSAGSDSARGVARQHLRREAAEEFVFVDLTPDHLRGSLFVAKALCSRAEPLVFGEPAPHRAGVDPCRRVHPIA